jgi:DNA-binding IclR family transcriptional regulator
MAKELNMTVSWAILKGSSVIVVDRVQNLNIDLLTSRLGLNLPIYSTSLGKILLAYLPPEEQKRILESVELRKFTSKTIVDLDGLIKHLKLCAERGYSTDEAETHEDLDCLAAPIRDSGGKVVAGINIMDERSRTSAEKLFQLADYLKEKALFISRQLGYGDQR